MTCANCGIAHHTEQSKKICRVKYRKFFFMQYWAKQNGKYVPSNAELEEIVPKKMECTECGVKMSWLKNTHLDNLVTLKFNGFDDFKMTCRGCNPPVIVKLVRVGNPNGRVRIPAEIIEQMRTMYRTQPIKVIRQAFPDIAQSHVYRILKREQRK